MPNDLGQGLPVSPTGDYNSYVTNLVADARVQENQNKWANEISPWSGTAMTVDDLDEAVAQVNFRGLMRPQGVAQTSDTMFITEVDATSFINNGRLSW